MHFMYVQALQKSKRRATEEEYQKYLHNYNIENVLNESTDFSEKINPVECIKQRSQNEEQLVNRKKSKTTSITHEELSNLLYDIEERMTESIKQIIKEELSQACENATSKMEEILSEFNSNIALNECVQKILRLSELLLLVHFHIFTNRICF